MRIGSRLRHIFSAQFTLGVTRVRAIKSETLRFRRLWVDLLRELASRRLWQFYAGEPVATDTLSFNLNRFGLSFRRCACCRPGYLFFFRSRLRWADPVYYQVRPCRRAFCPFCWARRIDRQYVRVKKKINQWRRDGVPVVFVYRTRREFVPAVSFSGHAGCDIVAVRQYAHWLRAVIDKHVAAYRKLVRAKNFQRHSRAALWRIVVWPTADGWFVETRQFIVAPPTEKKLPFVVLSRKNTRGTIVRLSLDGSQAHHDFNDQFYLLFGEFCRYPRAVLTEYVELTAAILWATRKIKMLSATGDFVSLGRKLQSSRTKRKVAALPVKPGA